MNVWRDLVVPEDVENSEGCCATCGMAKSGITRSAGRRKTLGSSNSMSFRCRLSCPGERAEDILQACATSPIGRKIERESA